jgi:AraC-like DNA-binding protein
VNHHENAGGSVSEPATCPRAAEHVARTEQAVDPHHLQRFERVISAMGRRLDQPMTNSRMADIACLSPCHFNRLFRHAVGIPPIQFHYALRLREAKRLLMNTDLSITEICFEVGYNSHGTFTTRFNQLVGLPPSAFRKLSRRFASARLGDVRLPLLEAIQRPCAERNIGGRISGARGDGPVFTALFPRAIPEGIPMACALTDDAGAYVLPNPGFGSWYIFAVAVPWSAVGVQLMNLDGMPRGRSGLIRSIESGWAGRTEIELSSARSLDPPVLTALPVLMDRLFARLVMRVDSSQNAPSDKSTPHESDMASLSSATTNGMQMLNLGEEGFFDFQYRRSA